MPQPAQGLSALLGPSEAEAQSIVFSTSSSIRDAPSKARSMVAGERRCEDAGELASTGEDSQRSLPGKERSNGTAVLLSCNLVEKRKENGSDSNGEASSCSSDSGAAVNKGIEGRLRRPSVKELTGFFELASRSSSKNEGSVCASQVVVAPGSSVSKKMDSEADIHAETDDNVKEKAKMSKSAGIVGDNKEWADALPFFSALCKEMDLGEMVKAKNFSFFEAMSALEVMDPKMDAGMSGDGSFRSVEEAIQQGVAPLDISIPQVLDIVDQLMACEATWHNGDSLSQTVYTCVYMHTLERTAEHSILHVFCKAVKSTCSLIRSMVAQADIHEEEEFVTLTYGLPMELDPDKQSLGMLNALEELLQRQLKAARGGVSKKTGEKLEPLQEDPALEEAFCTALLCRLRFRKALYNMLIALDKSQGHGLEAAHKHALVAIAEIKAIKESAAQLAGLQQPSGLEAAFCADGRGAGGEDGQVGEGNGEESGDDGAQRKEALHQSTASGRRALGFNEGINRRLLAPTPPRIIRMLSWEETLEHFEKLVQDLDRITEVPLQLSLADLQAFAMYYARANPGPISRARAQLVLMSADSKVLDRDPLKDLVWRSLMLPPDVGGNDAEVANWVSKAARPTAQLVKILCMNPARQRRQLGKVLGEWDTLLEQAEEVQKNKALTQYIEVHHAEGFWSKNVALCWVVEHTCRIVLQYLLLGFQLDVYMPQEFLMVYWYTEKVLHTLQTDIHAKEEAQFKEELAKAAVADAVDAARRKGGKKKKVGKAAEAKVFRPSLELLMVDTQINICKGIVRMLCGLQADNKIPRRDSPFNTEEQRYNQRFETLYRVRYPEPLHYSLFRRETDISRIRLPSKRLYQFACECFAMSQRSLSEMQRLLMRMPESDWRMHRLAELRQMETVARRNTLAASIVSRVGPQDLKLSFDLSQHPWFAVAVLKSSDADGGGTV